MSPFGALAWAAVCHATLQALILGFSWIRNGALDIMTLGAAEALAYLLTTFLVLHFHDRGATLRSSLGLRPTHFGLALVGVGLGLSLKLPAEALTARIERVFPTSEADLLWRASLYDASGLGRVAPLLIVTCLAAPLVEELFFRGALYGRLAKRSPPVAAAVTGVLFVVMHTDPRHWPALFIVTLLMSHLRLTSGSLLPCLALHVSFNAAGVLAYVSGFASPTRALQVTSAWIAVSWIFVALLLALLLKLGENPDVVRARAEDRA